MLRQIEIRFRIDRVQDARRWTLALLATRAGRAAAATAWRHLLLLKRRRSLLLLLHLLVHLVPRSAAGAKMLYGDGQKGKERREAEMGTVVEVLQDRLSLIHI